MNSVIAVILLLSSSIAPGTSWSLADRFIGRVPHVRPRRRMAAHASQQQQQQQHHHHRQQEQKSTKQSHQEILEFLDQPMNTMVGDDSELSSSQPSYYLDDVQDLVRTIVKAADQRKAEQIVALQVHAISTLTSYLVILSGSSRPQNSAIAAAISRDVWEQFELKPGGNGVPEGSAESGWMLLDYGSVMVHIMTPKSRLFYNVEGQWRDKGAREMDVSDCILPNTAVPESMESKVSTAPDNDPFWS